MTDLNRFHVPEIVLLFIVLAQPAGTYSFLYGNLGKEASSVTCNLSFSSATIGMPVLIYGFVTPPRSANVTVQTSDNNGSTWINLAVVLSDQNGNYSYLWILISEGVWWVRAFWSGDNRYLNATSPEQVIEVSKALSQVTCEVSSKRIMLGENVTISGAILPIHPIETVTIYISNDEVNWHILANVKTVSGGNYFYIWKPSSTGTYYFKSSWLGDKVFMKADSPDRELTVEEKSENSGLGLLYTILGLVFAVAVGGLFLLRRNRRKTSKRLSRVRFSPIQMQTSYSFLTRPRTLITT